VGTLSLSGAFDIAVRDAVGRVRPANYDCLVQGGRNCLDGPETTRSFPSGHFSETSTAAALICTQHLTTQLYGPPWDALTCGSAIAADGAVGVLRLVADDHWATDLVGAGAIGLVFGWGIPTLVQMRPHGPRHRDKAGAMIAPSIVRVDHGAAVGAVGIF
jgi:membrane-associated phospholipid phosphatase